MSGWGGVVVSVVVGLRGWRGVCFEGGAGRSNGMLRIAERIEVSSAARRVLQTRNCLCYDDF